LAGAIGKAAVQSLALGLGGIYGISGQILYPIAGALGMGQVLLTQRVQAKGYITNIKWLNWVNMLFEAVAQTQVSPYVAQAKKIIEKYNNNYDGLMTALEHNTELSNHVFRQLNPTMAPATTR